MICTLAQQLPSIYLVGPLVHKLECSLSDYSELDSFRCSRYNSGQKKKGKDPCPHRSIVPVGSDQKKKKIKRNKYIK